MKKINIAVLFKSEVRKLDGDYVAGCERVFLDDIVLLKRNNMMTYAYTGARVSQDITKLQYVKRIYYPFFVLDMIVDISFLISGGLWTRLCGVAWSISHEIAEFFYALSFVFKCRNENIYYVFEVPWVALWFPNKTVLTYHNFTQSIILSSHFLSRKLKNIVFVSRDLRDQYLEKYPGLDEKQCHVIHNSVDIIAFNDRGKFVKKTSMNKFTFIFASAWVETKGIKILAECIKKINKEYLSKTKFIICGSSDLWSMSDHTLNRLESIRKKLYKLKKFSNVEFHERTLRSKMVHLLKNAHFCLFPSVWREPFSLVVLESLACGTPVIAFDSGGTREVMQNAYNGYLIDTINVDLLCDKIMNIIERLSGEKYKQLSKNARVSSLSFDATHRQNKLFSLFHKICWPEFQYPLHHPVGHNAGHEDIQTAVPSRTGADVSSAS